MPGAACRYDARVKAMEVDERPEEQYTDIGGLDKQIQEVRGVALHPHLDPPPTRRPV